MASGRASQQSKETNPPLLCERRRASTEYSGVVQQVESPMTMNAERRKFIAGVGAAAASTAVPAGQALAQGNQQIGAKAMPYRAKPMPFDPKSITGISEKVLVSHYENNYVGAVKRLNAIGTQLAELDFAKAPIFVINGLKREELKQFPPDLNPRDSQTVSDDGDSVH
jgi:hypothetical protein